MNLKDYLTCTGLKPKDFAEIVKISLPSVYRYMRGRVPTLYVMAQIVKATGGAVTPEDFYKAALWRDEKNS